MSKFGGAPKCPICNKSVYMSEEVVAEGYKWHKNCFKCSSCNKMLDSSNMAAHRNEGKEVPSLFCSHCHRKTHDIHKIAAPTTAASVGGPNACGRCNKTVYAAEKVVAAGKPWHKSCFNCAECNKKLESTTVTDNEGEIYCKGCYGAKFGPKGFGYGGGAGALTRTQ
ncbi:PREDICTED: cysteine and glycine-rich protein 1-like [Amphimedon queenslandica]|uniref:LIM zinc-binding domain-containing protein n=1 Tax=Amphimedon queenslandica TaxID=400682 RepID=A0A1X7V4C7_AMPQE|nr:PREDICTED: cysteine and glycine-rich protein 1-like [Amphimedon queenslandica]|eukprot:XP_003385691.1 PREDICTED: cysteine and glycine-rich protein 1-like [Amphimedon queenslandica]